MAGKYAPPNEHGEKPYVVWKGWAGDSQVSYGGNLRAALLTAFGAKGAKAGNGRRARVEDIEKGGK